MVDKIREWMFYREFNQNFRKKDQQKPIINSAQTIAILYERTSDEDQRAVDKLKKSLFADNKRNIISLAFINNKAPLSEEFGLAYNINLLKWNHIPFGKEVDVFLSFKADVLILLLSKMSLHMEYLIAHSNANLIIGPDIAGAEKYFNLIVESKNRFNINSLINSILSMLEKVAIK